MRRIKLLAVGLVLALAGFVSAAGNVQEGSKKSCPVDKASCCAADCCKAEDSCCKAHMTKNQQAAAQPTQSTAQDKKDCCAGSECCKGEKGCCASCQKSEKTDKMAAHSCDMKGDGSAGGCCGASCCSHHKQKTD